MTRAHFVKKSQKEVHCDDGTVLPAGSSYWWWKFNFSSHKHCSKMQPKPQQLTQSEYDITVMDIQEALANLDANDLESGVQDICEQIENLRSECEDKLSNMPDQLQESSSAGQLLQERIDALESWQSDLEGVDLDVDEQEAADDAREELFDEWDPPENLEDATDEQRDAAFEEWLKGDGAEELQNRVEGKLDDKRQEILEELQSTSPM